MGREVDRRGPVALWPAGSNPAGLARMARQRHEPRRTRARPGARSRSGLPVPHAGHAAHRRAALRRRRGAPLARPHARVRPTRRSLRRRAHGVTCRARSLFHRLLQHRGTELTEAHREIQPRTTRTTRITKKADADTAPASRVEKTTKRSTAGPPPAARSAAQRM